MAYKFPKERMQISLRRREAEETGKPLYLSYAEVPAGIVSPTACKRMHRPVQEDEQPAAYVLNRSWLGYMPMYDRRDALTGEECKHGV